MQWCKLRDRNSSYYFCSRRKNYICVSYRTVFFFLYKNIVWCTSTHANNTCAKDEYEVCWQRSLLNAMNFVLGLYTRWCIQMKFNCVKLNFNTVLYSRILFKVTIKAINHRTLLHRCFNKWKKIKTNDWKPFCLKNREKFLKDFVLQKIFENKTDKTY